MFSDKITKSQFFSFIKKPSYHLPESVYVLKCLVSLAITYVLYIKFPAYPILWSMVSILLVLSPEASETNKLAWDRMKANMLGASVGFVFFVFFQNNLLILSAAVVLTIVLSNHFHLGSANRTALAGLVIVMVEEQANQSWTVAILRVICVILGCLIALGVNYFFIKQKFLWQEMSSLLKR